MYAYIEFPILLVQLYLSLLCGRSLTRRPKERALVGQVLNGSIGRGLRSVEHFVLDSLAALVRVCIVEVDDNEHIAAKSFVSSGTDGK